MADLKWNETTKQCYRNKLNCSQCELDEFCRTSRTYNPYRMKHLKYITLATYAQCGKPEEN